MTGECQLYMVIASPKAAKGHQAWAEGGTRIEAPKSDGEHWKRENQSAEVTEWGGI